MGRKPRWTVQDSKNGIETITLSSWKYFHDYMQEQFLDYRNYVFRGQSNENWKLEPTLNRYFRQNKIDDYKNITKDHLDKFKFSLRGRTPFLKEIIQNENEMWALGQHHGLLTPMLDFSFSPYVAAYFGFYEQSTNSKYRVIYALHKFTIESKFKNELDSFTPTSDHNSRLINQSGLFIKFDTDYSIEDLFEKKVAEDHNQVYLFKIRVPNRDRQICLRVLNRMNINHNTLFPDLHGVSTHCNMELSIKNY